MVLQHLHDNRTGGHFGVVKIFGVKKEKSENASFGLIASIMQRDGVRIVINVHLEKDL